MRALTMLALLVPSLASAATTGSVHLLVKNTGPGTFTTGSLSALADSDASGGDQTKSGPSVTRAAGHHYISFSGLQTYVSTLFGSQHTYQFTVSFWDTSASAQKTYTVASGTRFTGTGTYYVSKLGVTTYDPGAGYAFDLTNDAPPAIDMSGCYADHTNPAKSLYVYWSTPTRTGDFDRFFFQRATGATGSFSTLQTYMTTGTTSVTDTNLQPGTTYRYRLVHRDRYGALTTGTERACTTGDGDDDRDGFVGAEYGGNDCNDELASVYPGATEVANDGIDQDCDGADLTGPVDADGDGVADLDDNCAGVANADQADTDADGAGDACDADDDNDGPDDLVDNCPVDANADQADLDGDLDGDACDLDDDDDLVDDLSDACPRVADDQSDLDGDLAGDACDGDDDGDGVADELDVCPEVADDQTDADGDGNGDACDPDADGDEVLDVEDNCLGVANADQLDTDLDLVGDACDADDDNDGVADGSDVCPTTGDVDQADTDGDTAGDACDGDDDADGLDDDADNCALVSNVDQADLDADGAGDACDDDDDADLVGDSVDNCPEVANAGQGDLDADTYGDACDPDDDGDGVSDTVDLCPVSADADQTDGDCDMLGDACDVDDDDDGVDDDADLCPDEGALPPDLLGDGCVDDYCDVGTWLASLSAADIDARLLNSLTSKADNACASGADSNAAMNQFEALLHEAEAQEGRKISSDAVAALQEMHSWLLVAEACDEDGLGCELLGGCDAVE